MKAPTDRTIRRLHDWIDSHQDEMVGALQGVLRIRSLQADPEPGAPFGPAVRAALDYTLGLAAGMGFRTKDVDGYAGHAEFGAGEEMIAVLGHLDVVPEGDGWQHPPYAAVIEDGAIYGRGASDDKGPTYAGLFAARALMETGAVLRRRIRVIFGCNEESGFGCVRYYWETAGEERPVCAFTPDAGFPLIYAEKGITHLVLEKPLGSAKSELHIASASGGLRPNMVPAHAEAHLAGAPDRLLAALAILQRYWDRNVTATAEHGGITVRATGKSAHGSTPSAGDNAIVRLARALTEVELEERAVWLSFAVETGETTGAHLGIDGCDDIAGPLTSNLGILEYTNNSTVRLTYNIRYPVSWNIAEVRRRLAPAIQQSGWTLASSEDQPPLHVPLDRDPVSTLLRVYQEETGDTTSKPQTTGGGTYARATPNAVAFGAGFPGVSDGPAHEPDERLHIESYLNAAKIYAHALYELAR